jgi:hypothetical protein
MASPDEYEAAQARAEALRGNQPTAIAARYDGRLRRVVIRLSTGLDVAFAPRDAQGLETATPKELDVIEISPSGLGLHFPKLDADLYLPALLDGYLGSRSWAAARLGAQGTAASSPAKTAASRASGRLGGTSRKTA